MTAVTWYDDRGLGLISSSYSQ